MAISFPQSILFYTGKIMKSQIVFLVYFQLVLHYIINESFTTKHEQFNSKMNLLNIYVMIEFLTQKLLTAHRISE